MREWWARADSDGDGDAESDRVEDRYTAGTDRNCADSHGHTLRGTHAKGHGYRNYHCDAATHFYPSPTNDADLDGPTATSTGTASATPTRTTTPTPTSTPPAGQLLRTG